MAEETRTKHMEERLDAMELGLRQIQEEMDRCREENTATRDAIQSLEKTFEKGFANIN